MKTRFPDTSIEAEFVLIDFARQMPLWAKLKSDDTFPKPVRTNWIGLFSNAGSDL